MKYVNSTRPNWDPKCQKCEHFKKEQCAYAKKQVCCPDELQDGECASCMDISCQMKTVLADKALQKKAKAKKEENG